jgi:geranylgeranyl diphosphate synthase, type I
MRLPVAPASLAEVAERVDARLARLLHDERVRWSGFDSDLAEPIDEIARLVLAGGKRLRPAFAHWGFVAAGGDPVATSIVDAGAALELLHAFALFHDDVMDGSTTRRGAPTAHQVAIERHAVDGWDGEARRFGEGVAILVGDLAFVYADLLLQGASPAVWSLWNELRIELNIGQYLDILGSVRRERRLDKASRICRYKSGKYTIERPLHLGALLADDRRGSELMDALSAYGLPLGDAFQMRDDVLGAFGDTTVTGKPVGDDLREGKPTPLMAMAVQRATPAQHLVLDRVGRPDLTDHDVNAIQEVIVECGALAALEQCIADLTDEALAALQQAPIDDTARLELQRLAAYVSHREI